MATYTTLKSGSKGDEVKKLQQSLIDAGYNVGSSGADGIYGKNTAAAVKAYQQANGLSVDGIAGNQTLGKLYGGSTATTTPATTEPQQSNTYKYEAFAYDPYEKSDIVKQAEASIQQHIDANKQSPWTDTFNETMNKILNGEKFSYDLNGDALYQQYKDQYTTQGQMAMMDTMGQAAAMTGGYGNSYAQSVGQQAYQGHLQQLNDKVPELYQIALNQYNQENQDLKDQASILNTLVQQDNDNYYRDLEYLTGRADKLSEDEYNRYMDTIGMDYNIHSDSQTAGQQEKSDAYTHAMSLLSLGITPESNVLEMAGISSADAQAIVKKVKEQEKASAAAKIVNEDKSLSINVSEKMISQLQTYRDNKDNAGLKKYLNTLRTNKSISESQYNELLKEYTYTPEYKETAAVKDFLGKPYLEKEFLQNRSGVKDKYGTYKNYIKALLEKYEADLTDDDIATIAHIFGLE